jgi:hypothetical protein
MPPHYHPDSWLAAMILNDSFHGEANLNSLLYPGNHNDRFVFDYFARDSQNSRPA